MACVQSRLPHRHPFSDFFSAEGAPVHRLSGTDNPVFKSQADCSFKIKTIPFQIKTYYLSDKKKIKCKLPSIFKSNEEEIFNPTHIANRFCKYFTNIGPNLTKSIPVSDKSHRSFLNGGFINSFFSSIGIRTRSH